MIRAFRDLLLGTFSFDPPIIHAGGPFSDRAGATHDSFADFQRGPCRLDSDRMEG